MTATATCPCNANGYDTCEVADIVKAECLDCGFVTTDHTEILMWNGYGDHVGDPTLGCTRSRWTTTDGTVTDVNADA